MSLRRRIQLYPAAGDEPAANVWANYEPDGRAARITLGRDYPDCHPAAGWHVELWEAIYEVLAVEGRTLVCREVPK